MRKRILVAFLVVFMGLGPTIAPLCAAPDDEPNQFRVLAHRNESQINNWEKTATTIIVLTIVIGALGLVVGALQKGQANWCKITTVIVGLSISVLTLVLNTAFPGDYRHLRQQAVEGRKLLADLDIMINGGIPSDEANHRAWVHDFQEKLHQLLELGEERNEREVAYAGLVATVYAQSAGRKPDWITRLPSNSENLYFVGVGDDASLDRARQISRGNALNRAVDYFSSQFQGARQTQLSSFELGELSQYVVNSAENAGTYFEYDPASHSYRYYSLLRIHKDVALADLKLYGLGEKSAVPGELNQVVQTAPGLEKAYSELSFPYLLGTYKIAQRHLKLFNLNAARFGLYVGDVHHARPAQILIFRTERLANLSETKKLDYAKLKRTLKPEEILVNREVANLTRVRFSVPGRELLCEVTYSWSAFGEDYALVNLKSAAR